MAAKIYKPYELNKIAQLGTTESVRNEFTGANLPTFISQFSKIHYTSIKRTIDQKVGILGTALENTVMIVVRHNPEFENMEKVIVANGTEYDIVDVSSDDTNQYITYDIITMKKSEKVGAE